MPPLDPIWTNPNLLQQALDRARQITAMGGNTSVVPMNQPPAVPNDAAKADFLGINGAPGDPTVGMAPRVHPFQGVPLPGQADTPPPDFSTQDQNVINPDQGLPSKPKQQEASNTDAQITPAADTAPQGDGSIADTPISSATSVFDPFVNSLKDKAKTFWNNPASSDAMLAFGAAMLKAPNFIQGLGSGAEAVRQAAQPYLQPMSLADQQKLDTSLRNQLLVEKAKAALNPQRNDTFGGYQDFYDENNKHWSRSFINGKPVFTDDNGNVGSPQGAVRSSDSMVGQNARVFAKDNMEQTKAIEAGQQRRQQIDQAIALYDHSGAGAGVLDKLTRMVVDATGMDIGDTKVTNFQELNMLLQRSNLLEAQGQRGLGQLTEGERELIAKAWPMMSTNKQAFLDVMNTLKASIDRREQFYSEWNNETGGNGSFRAYYVRRMKDLNDQQKAAASQAGGGNKPSLNDIFK